MGLEETALTKFLKWVVKHAVNVTNIGSIFSPTLLSVPRSVEVDDGLEIVYLLHDFVHWEVFTLFSNRYSHESNLEWPFSN